jgi:hypothetical protein
MANDVTRAIRGTTVKGEEKAINGATMNGVAVVITGAKTSSMMKGEEQGHQIDIT